MNTNEDDKTKILSKENELKGKDEELSKIKT